MGRVQLLSDALINQIAAGEVVDRPASVLKELVENALDAGARNIRVTLRGGGVEQLSVVDDGSGMAPDDAERALLRHATSKLREEKDLLALRTLGFRGEALAAIAAVSRMSLTTAEEGAAEGLRIVCEGGPIVLREPAPPVTGTRIVVDELFFNVPARRKFLKREETESRHVEDALLRLALSHPQVGFFLDVDGRRKLSCPPVTDLRERMRLAVGPEVQRHLLPLEERALDVAVSGFVASPEFSLSNARGLYMFVNGRYVRDRGLIASLQRGLSGALPPGRQAAALVLITVDPAAVDVNVHPQKTEVRFADPRGVCDAVHAAVARAVRTAPWGVESAQGAAGGGSAAHYAQAVDRFLSRATPSAAEGAFWVTPATAPAFGQALPSINEAAPEGFFRSLRFLGLLGQQFLVMEGPGGTLVVLDAHAVAERIHASRFSRALAGERPAEPGLPGGTVRLPAGERAQLVAHAPALQRLGLDLEPFGADALALRALPPPLLGADLSVLLTELASALPAVASAQGGTEQGSALVEAVGLLACFAAGREPNARARSQDEVRALMHTLEETASQPNLPHARVVVLEIPQLELLRRSGAKLGHPGSAG